MKIIKESYLLLFKYLKNKIQVIYVNEFNFYSPKEAFSVAKRTFLDWKIRVRSTVIATHRGPETFEEAVQHYINRNVDLYDLPYLTSVKYILIKINLELL